jgi:hypothetical protein
MHCSSDQKTGYFLFTWILGVSMSSDIEEVVEFTSGYDSSDHQPTNMGLNASIEDSSSLKEKFKQSSHSRKRLEEKLEQSKIDREVKDFDYEDFED